MSDQSYRVVFEGSIAEGFSIGMVKKNLAQLFKADSDRIATIFSGQAVVMKRNIDKATAVKYQAALLKAGAVTIIRISNDTTTVSATPENKTEDSNNTGKIADWSLAPSGSMLLSEKERTKFEELELDLSHISLASSFLVPEAETVSESVSLDTSHLSVAEVGATLADPAISRGEEPEAIADIDATLAPVGAELADKKPEVEAPELNLSHLAIVETEG
ncbi:MAG: hypothetical protein AB8B86_07530 [Pseudomonadales bacterium]